MTRPRIAQLFVVVAMCTTACTTHQQMTDTASETPTENSTTLHESALEHSVVLDVVDGDTIRIDLAGSRHYVRLIGVNTPETKHPTKGVECYGPQASAFLTHWLQPGTRVRVERDLEARDVYRRLLLYVFVVTPSGERFVNLELVARGYATPLSIEPNTRYQQFFVDAAFDAQRHSRGLWGACP
jgi:micrococcal nuclease